MRISTGHRFVLRRAREIGLRLSLALALVLPGIAVYGSARAQPSEFSISVASVEELTGLTAKVSSADGVNVRAGPNREADILAALPDGTVVALRVDRADTVLTEDGTRWWPVSFNGQDGWISGAFLADSGGARPSDGESGDEQPSAAAFAAGDHVAVASADGLSMRAGPSREDERLAALGDGDVVQVMDGPFFDSAGDAWYLITDGDLSAYVFAAYLVAAPAGAVPAGAAWAGFGPGDAVAPAIGSGGVNIRGRASINSSRLGAVNEGVAVEVLDASIDKAGDVWYLVRSGEIQGYMFGAYLVDAASIPQQAAGGPTGTFIMPLADYVLTQNYGCSIFNFYPYDANLGCPFHNGTDLAAPAYTPVLAADGGVVTFAGWCDCGLGYYVEIDHGNGFATVYGHMAEQPYVATGQSVNQGDVIGPVGSTGISTGPHVHFMLKVNGVTVDPMAYI